MITVVGLGLLAVLATAAPASAIEETVDLGTAAPFSILGGQTVTNTGPTTLSGDLGVSPGTAITGFPPGTLTGTTHATDGVAGQAQSDVGIAYDDAAGRATTQTVSGDLVGRTLVAGVYTASGPLAVSGTLTFDGQYNPNSVFIVQAASTLITATASHIETIHGANACNIFWQVGTSATLGTASTFQGSILAQASVTVTTSAHVQGRALARNGAVTLDNNVFTSPDCNNTGTLTGASPTTTTVTSTPTATTGGAITVTAIVTSPTGTPTGSVTFYEGDTVLGTGTLVDGTATLTVPAGPTPKARTVTVIYTGTVDFAPSPPTGTTFTITTPAVTTTPATTAAATTPATTSPASAVPSPTTSVTDTPAVALGTTSRPVLPNTGTSHLTGFAASGLALLVTGSALLFIARRRTYPRRRH